MRGNSVLQRALPTAERRERLGREVRKSVRREKEERWRRFGVMMVHIDMDGWISTMV